MSTVTSDPARKTGTCSTCRTCGETKSLDDFYFHSASGKPRVHCKDCINAAARAYHKANRDKARARYQRTKQRDPERHRRTLRAGNLRWKYGITIEDYEAMFRDQGGCCAICGSGSEGENFHIDHDHVSGAIRGLLCESCNLGLGKFGDNQKTLERAARYLANAERKNEVIRCH